MKTYTLNQTTAEVQTPIAMLNLPADIIFDKLCCNTIKAWIYDMTKHEIELINYNPKEDYFLRNYKIAYYKENMTIIIYSKTKESISNIINKDI